MCEVNEREVVDKGGIDGNVLLLRGVVGQLIGNIHTPAVTAVHILQNGGFTVYEAGRQRCGDTRGLPAELPCVGLVKDETFRVAGGGDEASAIADAYGVGVVGALAAFALLQHLVVDVVARAALFQLVLGVHLDALAFLGYVGDVGLVAGLPVGIFVDLLVFRFAAR